MTSQWADHSQLFTRVHQYTFSRARHQERAVTLLILMTNRLSEPLVTSQQSNFDRDSYFLDCVFWHICSKT